MLVAFAAILLSGAMGRSVALHRAETELSWLAPIVADRVAPEISEVPRGDATLGAVLDDLAAVSGASFDLFDAEARPVAASGGTVDAARSMATDIAAALESGSGSAVRRSSRDTRRRVARRAVRIELPDGRVFVLRTELPIPAPALVPASAIVTGSAAVLLIVLLTVSHVSGQVDLRIRRMTDAARRFAAGDLGHRLDAASIAEMASLADSLNEMAAQLERRIDLLRARDAEQAAMLGSMSAGMIALDREHRILRSNAIAKRLLDADPESPIRGRLIEEVLRIPGLHELLEQADTADSTVDGEIETDERVVRCTIEPLIEPERGRLGLLVLLTDITQLRRLERLRSDFAANVSHELRTPITNIRGYAETLTVDLGEELPPTVRRFAEVIARNAQRLEAIIEDLLALAGLEQVSDPSSAASLEEGRTSAEWLVDSVTDQFEQAACDRGIRLVADVQPELELRGGVQLLEQALSNLVGNAIRYCPSGTTVLVEVGENEDGGVELSVTDDGPGIEAEHLPRLFERFYRVDSARSRDLGGTGLGLAIVKHVAVAHGGRAEVESTIGEGSRFRIILPPDARVEKMKHGAPGVAPLANDDA